MRRLLYPIQLMVLLALLAGCAQPALRPDPTASFWQGRLALRVDIQPVQSLSASFELQGSAARGSLLLLGPLGQAVARLDWQPGRASLSDSNGVRRFDSIDDLLTQSLGTTLPVSALFEWLAGREAVAPGWQADLSELKQGRLGARRVQPAPVAELRLLIEQATP